MCMVCMYVYKQDLGNLLADLCIDVKLNELKKVTETVSEPRTITAFCILCIHFKLTAKD